MCPLRDLQAPSAAGSICTVPRKMDVVLASFLSALAIAFVSHVFARVFKAPVTVFLIAGILPTVPGAGMYRIVYYIIENDREMCSYYLIQTLEIAGMIALAIFIMDTIFRFRKPLRECNTEKK